MDKRKSAASILLFAGSILCFFLPFVTVSCGGVKVITLSGQQMATGTSIQVPQPFGPPKSQEIAPDPFAAVAALCAIVGVGLSLAGTRLAVPRAIAGGVGSASLGIMASRMESQIQSATQGMGSAHLEVGFSMTIAFLIAGTALNIYLLTVRKDNVKPTEPATGGHRNGPEGNSSGTIQPRAPVPVACRACGRHLELDSVFCGECGAKVASKTGANERTAS